MGTEQREVRDESEVRLMGSAVGSATLSGSGNITVPSPEGFSTFLIRIGIFLRMTYLAI